jgi:S-adenosylmethionine decarboxylase
VTQDIKDYFVERDGLRYAGTHLLLDFWDTGRLDDIELIERALRSAVDACDATLLKLDLHRFSESGGISGVAILAESHMSIHTWPERRFAAIDIFMCGQAKPHLALAVLQSILEPGRMQVSEQRRGILPL